MTDDEKRRLRIDLEIEREKAEGNVRALRQALKGMSDSLMATGEWLSSTARSLDVSQLKQAFYSRTLAMYIDVFENEDFRAAMDYDKMIALREEFIQGQMRLDELSARIREMKATA
ncbi:MAG: hypothetical protein ACLP07_00745 [Terracidiphilus sp.]